MLGFISVKIDVRIVGDPSPLLAFDLVVIPVIMPAIAVPNGLILVSSIDFYFIFSYTLWFDFHREPFCEFVLDVVHVLLSFDLIPAFGLSCHIEREF